MSGRGPFIPGQMGTRPFYGWPRVPAAASGTGVRGGHPVDLQMAVAPAAEMGAGAQGQGPVSDGRAGPAGVGREGSEFWVCGEGRWAWGPGVAPCCYVRGSSGQWRPASRCSAF